MSTNPSHFIEKVALAFRKDRKRVGVVTVLGLVLIGLWTRLIVGGPAVATASFIRRSVAAMTNVPELVSKPVASSPLMEWLATPKRQVKRNLFSLHLDYYARSGSARDLAEDPAKSTNDEADQDKERQILLDNLQSQAAKLKLQTTVMGTNASAMINGQLLKQGDTISGFSLVKIEARKVTLEQEGIVLFIVMPE